MLKTSLTQKLLTPLNAKHEITIPPQPINGPLNASNRWSTFICLSTFNINRTNIMKPLKAVAIAAPLAPNNGINR